MKEISTSDFISLNKVKTLSGSSAAVLISTNLIVSFIPANSEYSVWTYSKWAGIVLSL